MKTKLFELIKNFGCGKHTGFHSYKISKNVFRVDWIAGSFEISKKGFTCLSDIYDEYPHTEEEQCFEILTKIISEKIEDQVFSINRYKYNTEQTTYDFVKYKNREQIIDYLTKGKKILGGFLRTKIRDCHDHYLFIKVE